MNPTLIALLDALRIAEEPAPSDLVSAVRGLPEPGALPSPWDTWTLIGLVRHRRRQLWVAEVVATRLRGDLPGLASFGAFGHPEGVPGSGIVPGLPEWEYDFHGRGCCLTHKVDGDIIDVDFWDDSADYFDTFFYVRYLESLRCSEHPEQRLRELYPAARAIRISVADLMAIGALAPFPNAGSHPYRIVDEVLARSDAVDEVCRAWADRERRVWIAAVLGDWPAAQDAAIDHAELQPFMSVRAERCREIRRHRLRRDTGGPGGADALIAMADLGSPDLERCLKATLRSPPSGSVSAALDIIGKRDDPRWCRHVYSLFFRLDPSGPLPEPHLWLLALTFLLKHGYRTASLLAALPRAGGVAVGEASLLALEHAPPLALPLIRKGLLSDVPMNRTSVAALLALIGQPWSQRELLRALETSDDQMKTADARAALRECGDEEAIRLVLDWEGRNPHEAETGSYLQVDGRRLGPFYSFDEIALNDRAEWIRYEMHKLHDRVMRLRHIEPPEPKTTRRRWWPL